MPPNTKTETTELKDLVLGLREEMRVGFANNNTKFSEDTLNIPRHLRQRRSTRSYGGCRRKNDRSSLQ